MTRSKLNKIFLGIGSNLESEKHINSCINYFKASFKDCIISPIYQSPSYGFIGNDFYNLVIAINTHFELYKFKQWIMRLEDIHGRDRSQQRYSNRTLDIDILLYNDLLVNTEELILPRPELLRQDYILKPMVDIAASLLHPSTRKSFLFHWQHMKKSQEIKLKKIQLKS
jgi:2-amino-4-hydroxy-6-hydroxymethyldihydropteridine diphosphokinase